jgi:hypothetical protein
LRAALEESRQRKYGGSTTLLHSTNASLHYDVTLQLRLNLSVDTRSSKKQTFKCCPCVVQTRAQLQRQLMTMATLSVWLSEPPVSSLRFGESRHKCGSMVKRYLLRVLQLKASGQSDRLSSASHGI